MMHLTHEDISAIKEAIQEAHQCRYDITPSEMATVKGMVKSVEQAKTVTLRIVVTGIVLFFFGLLGKGVLSWLIEWKNKLSG